MTKRGDNTPISDDEAEEVVSRIMGAWSDDRVADVFDNALRDGFSWQEFLENKLGVAGNYSGSERQYNMLNRGRQVSLSNADAMWTTYDIKTGTGARWRNTKTGQFMSGADVRSRLLTLWDLQ